MRRKSEEISVGMESNDFVVGISRISGYVGFELRPNHGRVAATGKRHSFGTLRPAGPKDATFAKHSSLEGL